MQYVLGQMKPVSVDAAAYYSAKVAEFSQMGTNVELSEAMAMPYIGDADPCVSHAAALVVKDCRIVRWWLALAHFLGQLSSTLKHQCEEKALCRYWRMANHHVVLCSFTEPSLVAELENSIITRDGC